MNVKDIPQELVDMLDRDAGKQHNRQGPVLASLARILTRYGEMQANETVGCTGLSAQWCPNHGTCACPDRRDAMDDPDCPLHSCNSSHAEVDR